MKKKTYINPAMQVVNMQSVTQLMAGSQFGSNGEFGEGVNVAGRNSDSDFEDDEEEF